jgi:non-ribosomal peptide synthetase component E (peptide arylation enzyme)
MLARSLRHVIRPLSSRGFAFKATSNVDLESSTLTEFILKDAAKHGDKLALVDGITGRGIKYSELSTRIGSAAAGLRELGFGPGKVGAHTASPSCL